MIERYDDRLADDLARFGRAARVPAADLERTLTGVRRSDAVDREYDRLVRELGPPGPRQPLPVARVVRPSWWRRLCARFGA